MVTISLFGVVGVIVSCIPVFSTPRYRLIRAGMNMTTCIVKVDITISGFFLCFGFFGIFPIPHMFFVNDIEFARPIFWREVIMGSLYVIGNQLLIEYDTR
jgi:predicted membrane channel-forming protein YqfA (hemolysin III family)